MFERGMVPPSFHGNRQRWDQCHGNGTLNPAFMRYFLLTLIFYFLSRTWYWKIIKDIEEDMEGSSALYILLYENDFIVGHMHWYHEPTLILTSLWSWYRLSFIDKTNNRKLLLQQLTKDNMLANLYYMIFQCQCQIKWLLFL